MVIGAEDFQEKIKAALTATDDILKGIPSKKLLSPLLPVFSYLCKSAYSRSS